MDSPTTTSSSSYTSHGNDKLAVLISADESLRVCFLCYHGFANMEKGGSVNVYLLDAFGHYLHESAFLTQSGKMCHLNSGVRDAPVARAIWRMLVKNHHFTRHPVY